MSWTPIVTFAAGVVLLFLLKRVGQISKEHAREYRNNGALLIDVRSAVEYHSGHLSGRLTYHSVKLRRCFHGAYETNNKYSCFIARVEPEAVWRRED